MVVHGEEGAGGSEEKRGMIRNRLCMKLLGEKWRNLRGGSIWGKQEIVSCAGMRAERMHEGTLFTCRWEAVDWNGHQSVNVGINVMVPRTHCLAELEQKDFLEKPRGNDGGDLAIFRKTR